MQSRKVINRIDAELAATTRVLETLNRREDALRIKRTLNYVAYLVVEDAEQGGDFVEFWTLFECWADENKGLIPAIMSQAFVRDVKDAIGKGWIMHTGTDPLAGDTRYYVAPRLAIRMGLPGYTQEGGKSNALLATLVL